MNAVVTQPVQVAGAFEPNPVMIRGEGAPVVYLHGVFGPEWNGVLDDLAESRRVIAPSSVGADEPDEMRNIDSIFELSLYYDEVFDRLGLGQFDLIGHSFGGMAAAEYAALFPKRVRRLVLIDPFGLWRDDIPVSDHLYATPEGQMALHYADPSSPQVKAANAVPEEPQARMAHMLKRMTGMASSSYFLWPIPDRGLKKRLHRVTAPTLVVWGERDTLVPPAYAQEFAQRIADARVAMIPRAGHTPQVEERAAVSEAIRNFLS
jgi:pimeloyl-ACP methyl ester carboxylesterase